jgi:hypothetical protein
MDRENLERWQKQLRTLARTLGEMLYGATIYDWVREIHKERGMVERLFILVVFGDLFGVPVLPPYYALRLLPYAVPSISMWRYSLMRERDLVDQLDGEIG